MMIDKKPEKMVTGVGVDTGMRGSHGMISGLVLQNIHNSSKSFWILILMIILFLKIKYIFPFFFLISLDSVSLFNSGYLGTHYVDQTCFEFTQILLILPPGCWKQVQRKHFKEKFSCTLCQYVSKVNTVFFKWKGLEISN